MKITKEDCKNKQEINIENYLRKKKIKKENMGEIDTTKCLKKTKKTNRLLKKRKKMNIKNVCLFSLSGIKNEKINLGFW